MTSPLVGHEAPDFTLTNQHGTPVTLSALRGAPVLVVFVPFAFSGNCTQELCDMRDSTALAAVDGATVLVVSCDSKFTNSAWAEQHGYAGDVLSDFWPHGEAARAYGVFDEDRGLAVRGSFVIDAAGVVTWAVINGTGETRPVADYLAPLAAAR